MADEQTERERLEALFFARFPTEHTWPNDDWHQRFTSMLDCEAYESAALMLVPEGWSYILDTTEKPTVSLWNENYCVAGEYCGDEPLEGATPALALCAAIEAAMPAGEHDPA